MPLMTGQIFDFTCHTTNVATNSVILYTSVAQMLGEIIKCDVEFYTI